MSDLEKHHTGEHASDENVAMSSPELDSAQPIRSSGALRPGSAVRALPALPQPDSDGPARRLPNGGFVTTLTLSNDTCRWPIGNPTEPDFHYCGERPDSTGPYCDAHERKSYRAGKGRIHHRPSRSG
jgi:GcrA cell cycle regulator